MIIYYRLKFLLFLTILIGNLVVSAQNVEREVAMGEESKKQLEQQIGFYHHPSEKYLTELGDRLVLNLENRVFDYHFGILDMKEPNALAVPGGDIFFSRGILLLANSEKELAGVMGHEIIHIYKSHSRKANNRSVWTGIFKIPGAIVGVFAPTAGGILMAPFAMFDAGYSRKNEKQSDELGAQLAAKTGYDPSGLANLLQLISKESEMETGTEEQRSFFSTHPYTPKRIEELNKTIDKLNFNPENSIEIPRQDFLQKIEGLVIGDNPAHGVFKDSKFLHPELNIAFLYPENWETINTPSFVGFVSPDQKAQMVLSLSDTSNTPTEKAFNFATEYRRYYGYEPVRNESMIINGDPAHILSYEGQSEEGSVILNFLWLNRKEHAFRIASLSLSVYSELIVKTAKSLHSLTDSERQSIRKTVLKIVQARTGESLLELSDRTANVLDIDFLALINDIDKSEKLKKDQLIKIGIEVNYN